MLTTPVLSLAVVLQLHWDALSTRTPTRSRRGEGGQASAEYALVLLGAAAVALLVVGWATKTDKVGKLLDSVLEKLLGHAG